VNTKYLIAFRMHDIGAIAVLMASWNLQMITGIAVLARMDAELRAGVPVIPINVSAFSFVPRKKRIRRHRSQPGAETSGASVGMPR